MELSKLERRLIEKSTKNYEGFMYRKSQLLGWIGVVFFAVGLMRTFSWSSLLLPAWCYRLFLWMGFAIIFWSQYALAVTVIGKLSDKIHRLEQQSGKSR
jgi:hypothetical protein